MARLKNTTINGTGALVLPKGTTAQRVTGNGSIRYNTDTNSLETYNANNANWSTRTIPFKERTIITNTYTQGGYKGSTAWNTCNRTYHATDTSIQVNNVERSHNYQWGANSRHIAYVFGAGNGHAVSSNVVTAYNMHTESFFTSGFTRNVARSRHLFGGVFDEHYRAYINGEDSRIEEFNMVTGTLLGDVGTATWSGGNVWGMSGENFGILYNGGSSYTYNFATRTGFGRGGTQPSSSHQQKSVQSKIGYGWAGNEGSYRGGNNLRRTNMITNSTSGTISKPVTNCGEENFTMGQDHQYMLGQYNGLQNNISWRFNYGSESGFQGGSSMQPKGQAGQSSATCNWRE